MSRWFRFYDDVLTDPKIHGLPVWIRWMWVEMLCVASKNGGDLGTVDELFKVLSRRRADVEHAVCSLCAQGLLDVKDGAYRPHNWESRQYKSDLSTQRVRQFRKKRSGPTGNVSGNVAETEHNRTEQNPLTPYEGESKQEAIQEGRVFVRLTSAQWKIVAARYAAETGRDPPTSDRASGWWFPASWLNGEDDHV